MSKLPNNAKIGKSQVIQWEVIKIVNMLIIACQK